ncbi:MAG: type IV pilin, partial [Candidatus Thermoplasmatota archaeon]|nr:type IV pilin [Candidatus Thermoplasmatota archaeon]
MKANRKFKNKDDAVSAVIGVILMVAITVAIAATVYVYVSGMIGTSPETTPNMQLVKDSTAKKLTVASADPGNLKWSDFNVTVEVDNDDATFDSITNYTSAPSGTINAGQSI